MKILILSLIFASALTARANSVCVSYFKKQMITQIKDLTSEDYEKIAELAKAQMDAYSIGNIFKRNELLTKINEEVESLPTYGIDTSVYTLVRTQVYAKFKQTAAKNNLDQTSDKNDLNDQKQSFEIQKRANEAVEKLLQKYKTRTITNLASVLQAALLHESGREDVNFILHTPLVLKQVDVTDNGPFGTVLHTAARVGHLEAIDILVNMGADINLRSDFEQLTPLDLAKENGQSEASLKIYNLGGR